MTSIIGYTRTCKIFKPGDRVLLLGDGPATVIKQDQCTNPDDPYSGAVWIEIDSDGVRGTASPRALSLIPKGSIRYAKRS